MEPYLPDLDKQLYYKYLDCATNYFEFGSGGSTYQACSKSNIKKIYAVESDLAWINKLKQHQFVKDNIENSRLHFEVVDLKCKPNTWGKPTENVSHETKIKYPRSFNRIKPNDVDMIMIDGRFRAACALNVFSEIGDNTIIFFDDFLNRPYYHIILKYYDIIDRASRAVVLKKKQVNIPATEIIEKYEKDYR